MESILKKLAEQNGVTPEEVERDMLQAISAASSPELNALRQKLGRELTVEEFISFCVGKVYCN